MYRKFIAAVAAASIVLTAFGATSASAGNRETTNALAAILGLAVVGAIIHENRKDKKKRSSHYHADREYQPKHQSPRYDPPRYHQPKPRPLPDRVNRKLLPQQCFRSYETHRGKVRMFGNRCLQRHYKHAHRLPQHCKYVFNTPRGDRRGYEARCLRDRGYRLARG